MTLFTKRITVNADDGMGSSGNFYTTLTAVRLGNDGGDIWDAWFTFRVVAIPQGANILDAKLTFEAESNDVSTVLRTNIYCNDIDNAVSPTNRTQQNALARTTAFTAWDGEGAWTAGVTYDTPDFAPSVQEVINRGSWVENNDLMVLVDDDSSDVALRRAKSLEHAGTNVEALLTVNWSLVSLKKQRIFLIQ